MLDNIRNNIQILHYPKVDSFENLSDDKIIEYIDKHKDFIKKYNENKDYYIGRNTFINNKKDSDKNNPDSRLSVSYARTLTSIVKGYMYRPSNITYSCEDENYLETLEEIFEANNEPLKTSELGEAQSKYGIGLELLYAEQKQNIPEYLQQLSDIKQENIQEEKPSTEFEIQNAGYPKGEVNTIPYFCNIDPQEVILFYSMNLYEKLIGAIRFYIIDEDKKNSNKIYKVEIYYPQTIVEYSMIEDLAGKKTIEFVSEQPNYFYDIPFAVYKNNNEYHADYEPVKPLIDAYDVLLSDSLNEIQRFASAYLILKGMIAFDEADGAEREKVLESIKTTRIMQFLDSSGQAGAEFLTRSIPSDFFNQLKMSLREDIQYHSHIPDFRDRNFATASGISMLYSLFDFENFCADKQALFEVGLRQRINLINNFLKVKAIDIDKVSIKFERNLPVNVTEKVQIFTQLYGKLPDEDALKILPKEIVPDINSTLERLAKQKEENMAMFDIEKMYGGQEEENSEEENIEEEEEE